MAGPPFEFDTAPIPEGWFTVVSIAPPRDVMLEERIGRLEATIEGLREAIHGLRHGQTMTMAVISILVAIGIAGTAYTLTRVDANGEKIDRLPGELMNIANSISNAITAAQPPPVIIQLPAETFETSPEAKSNSE